MILFVLPLLRSVRIVNLLSFMCVIAVFDGVVVRSCRLTLTRSRLLVMRFWALPSIPKVLRLNRIRAFTWFCWVYLWIVRVR